MNNLDVMAVALLVLSPEELNDCFLKAYNRLSADDQELVGDAGEKIQAVARLPEAEEALGAVGMIALHVVTNVHGQSIIAHRVAGS